jgi:hypothetical protein
MNLESRLSRLEEQHNPARGYVIRKAENETGDHAINAAGIKPSENDLVIMLCRGAATIAPDTRLVSCFAVAS